MTQERARPSRLFVEFLGSRLGAAVLSLGTFVVVTHGTDVTTAGIYISAVSYGILLYSFLDLGTGPNLVRGAVHGEYKRRVSEYVWTRAFLTAAVVAIGGLGVLILFPSDARTAGFVSLIYVASSMNAVAGPVGQVIGDASAFRILTLLQGVLVFLAVLATVLLVDSPSPALLVLAFSMGGVVASIAGALWVKQHMTSVPLGELPRTVREQLRAVLMLALATGAGSIYLRIDQTLVLHIKGAANAAYYGIASRIAIQARLVPSALQLSISTLLADRLRKRGGVPRHEGRLLTRIAMRTGLGLAIGVIAVSDLAVTVLAGKKYDSAVVPTIILAVSLVATCYSYVVGTAVVMSGRDAKYLIAMSTAVVVNIAGNLLLMPKYGIEASAVVAALTEIGTVTALAEIIRPLGAATSRRNFAGALAIAILAAGAKYGLMSTPTWLNACGSAALAAMASILLLSSYRLLRVLPAVTAPEEVEVVEIAADRA